MTRVFGLVLIGFGIRLSKVSCRWKIKIHGYQKFFWLISTSFSAFIRASFSKAFIVLKEELFGPLRASNSELGSFSL